MTVTINDKEYDETKFDEYFMKEGLRKAYPNEPLPEFYRIDPREVIGLLIKGQKIMRGEEKPTKFYKDKKKELEGS